MLNSRARHAIPNMLKTNVSDLQKEKYLLLSKAWILIHPSKKEGWGLNVIEANSVKTPVVGYNVPGLSDSILDGKTGYLVDCEALSMADGVEGLIQNKKLYSQMCENAKTWSERFTWEKAARMSLGLIIKVIEK